MGRKAGRGAEAVQLGEALQPAPIEDLFAGLDPDAGPRYGALMDVFEDYVQARAEADNSGRAQRPWRDSSIAMYRAAWNGFAAYCAARRLALPALTVPDLEAFLQARARRPPARGRPGQQKVLNGRYAFRLLSLIDRLVRFDAARRPGTEPNAAPRQLIEREYRTVNYRDQDTLPRFLDKVERARLVEVLTLPLGADAAAAPRSWLELRDNAAVAVQLGAGITPGEVRQLRLAAVHVGSAAQPWRLDVVGNGNTPPRQAVVAQWAGRVLADWLRLRAAQSFVSDWVFCTDVGGQWAKNTCGKASDTVLERAGIRVETGHYRLRHTFALIELRDYGRSFEEVARALGVHDTFAWRTRYERVIDEFRKVG